MKLVELFSVKRAREIEGKANQRGLTLLSKLFSQSILSFFRKPATDRLVLCAVRASIVHSDSTEGFLLLQWSVYDPPLLAGEP